MEHMGAISDGELSSLSVMYAAEEAEFMSQPPNNSVKAPSTFWPCHDSTMNMAGLGEGSYHSSDLSNSDLYTSSHFRVSSLSQQSYYMNDSMSMDLCMADVEINSLFLVEGNQEMSDGNAEESAGFGYMPEVVFADKDSELIKGSEMSGFNSISEDKGNNNRSEKPKKRSRSSEDVRKNIRMQQSMVNHKLASTSNNEDDCNADLNGQSSSSCSSEDDSINASQKLNGKTRARRELATGPQSLYARKRRERINERMRILQTLVPNGTKVDISTMLEEAVHYVKFLQLQIKLLISDDLWMYAPIAYNGLDIGLDLKMTPLGKL
ncbi:hypothetical protein FH972_004634 [Carpinus fangiana]|uniref:BHLH domain-containing protein n=1 Tax=Carpinus fangiana TaxID=176857 RepID=A0A5N6QLN9_9ROSI|nr:hypothetical protein FH972_004634 [Carpinus fangiana]